MGVEEGLKWLSSLTAYHTSARKEVLSEHMTSEGCAQRKARALGWSDRAQSKQQRVTEGPQECRDADALDVRQLSCTVLAEQRHFVFPSSHLAAL